MKYSIIIPCYNSEEYILNPLTSLKNQTYKNLEIVLVNDGSKDNTEKVILDFKKSNPDLNIVYQRIENSGPSTARNTGFALSTGDYVCFLDSDDSYDEHLFEEIESIITDDVDAVYFGSETFDKDGNVIFKYTDLYTYCDNLTGIEAAKKFYLKDIYFYMCSAVFKRDIILKNNIKFINGVYLGEDTNFIYKTLFNCNKVRVIPKPLFRCLYRENSLMHHKFTDKYLTEFDAIRDTLDYIKTNNVPEMYEYMYSFYYYTRCTVCKTKIKSMKWYEGFKFIKFNKKYIPKVKKIKGMHLNKMQKRVTRIYSFSKLLFFCLSKVYIKKTKQ